METTNSSNLRERKWGEGEKEKEENDTRVKLVKSLMYCLFVVNIILMLNLFHPFRI